MNFRIFLAILFLYTGNCAITQSVSDAYDQWISPYIVEGLFDYQRASESLESILELEDLIARTDLTSMDQNEIKAFYINAYNISVITKVLKNYPIVSVQDLPKFFTTNIQVAGSPMTLDQLEKIWLAPDQDPRLHMVLVCGALSCPPLPSSALRGSTLDEQLDQLTSEALSSTRILNIDDQNIRLSQIFNWYTFDFGNDIEWISKYYNGSIVPGLDKSYMDYNWAINDINNTAGFTISGQDIRYFTSYLYGPGQYEVSIFNNYFTELRGGDFRSNFFTSFIRYTHGYSKKINFSLDFKWRAVSFGNANEVSMFDALNHGNEGSTLQGDEEISFRKIGLSAIIPRVKYQPFNTRPNLSVQHAIAIPTNYGSDGAFLDWGSPSIYNDVFYDITTSSKSSIFLQASVWLENIGGALFRQADGYYQFSIPLTFIYQYFPSRKSTIYGLVNVAPQWGYSVSGSGANVDVINDSYQQIGVGVKQYISEATQLELLYTKFFTARENSSASTFNLGIRYFGW